jgi:peptidoglycan/xylan/chitin deacetylase (PgdA/CDA1 family)
MLLSVGVSAMPQSVSAATTATSLTAAPRVTFTFDDGLTSALTNAAPALAASGFSGTDYIITGCVDMTTAPNTCKADPNDTYLSWDQIKTLHDQYGWNIASHTVTHPYLASTGGGEQALMTPTQVDTELKQAKADLVAHGYDAVDFAAPFGDYDNIVLATAAKYYATLRGFADINPNAWPYNDRLVQNYQVQDTAGETTAQTVARIKGYIDTAVTDNQWAVLTFHNITAGASSGVPDNYEFPASGLAEIAAYVKAKGIAVVSPHDALVNGTTNMLGDGTFDTTTLSTDWQNRNTAALYGSWVTDDQTGALIKKDTATNGSYVLGNATSAANSLYISAGASTSHIWAPRVAVNPNTTYVVKGFFNITNFTPGTTATQPEVSYHVEEYDANGVLLNDHYASSAVRYDVNVNAIRVKNANFTYKPTAANAAYARIYVDVQGDGGITGYMDNLEMFDPASTTVTGKAGDVNGDGAVNLNDLSIVSSNWNKTGMTAAQGDLNGDGVVNLNDLSILSSNWGK